MALIPLPTKFQFSKVSKWGLIRAGNTLRSNYTGYSQRIVYPYSAWIFEGTLIDYPEPEASSIRSFLTLLEGQKNSFQIPVPGWTPNGRRSQTNNVPFTLYQNLAVRSNYVTIIMGAGRTNTSTELPLINGDYFSVNGELKVALSVEVNMFGVNLVNVKFDPPNRQPWNAGDVVTYINPVIELVSVDDDVALSSVKEPYKQQTVIKAIEAI